MLNVYLLVAVNTSASHKSATRESMILPRKLIKVGKKFTQEAYSALPFPGVSSPVFIIGCGRSGTTIFGTALSKHRDITYLNEPHHLWFSAYPETDIWTHKANHREGKLFLTSNDAHPRKRKKLSRLFQFETVVSGKPILVEKLPINNFRLEFIKENFPDARFIHIYRNGLEVARSIEEFSKRGEWFGANSYKWERLVKYAKELDGVNKLPQFCTSYFDKGLLEWRLSTEAAVEFLCSLSDDEFFEVSYDEFIGNPVGTIIRAKDYIGVDFDRNVKAFVSDCVARRTSKLNQKEISEKVQMLGGKLLPLSMDGGKGLSKRCS